MTTKNKTKQSLPERIIAVHRAFRSVPHAFGGALALAYYAEPRATRDIDCNIFIPATSAMKALRPLAKLGADIDGAEVVAARDGQVRVLWEMTPIDLFFSYDKFHDAALKDIVIVPFSTTSIPILSATHLAVCKVVFNRPRDWVDIDAMLEHGTPIDAPEALKWVGRICGDDDPRFIRLATVLTA